MSANEDVSCDEGSLNVYAKFLTDLTARLETELADGIKHATECDLIDDPEDETELIGIDLSMRNWRSVIRNLTTIRDALNALDELGPAEVTQ